MFIRKSAEIKRKFCGKRKRFDFEAKKRVLKCFYFSNSLRKTFFINNIFLRQNQQPAANPATLDVVLLCNWQKMRSEKTFLKNLMCVLCGILKDSGLSIVEYGKLCMTRSMFVDFSSTQHVVSIVVYTRLNEYLIWTSKEQLRWKFPLNKQTKNELKWGKYYDGITNSAAESRKKWTKCYSADSQIIIEWRD